MEHQAADELDIVMSQSDRAAWNPAHKGECLRQEVLERILLRGIAFLVVGNLLGKFVQAGLELSGLEGAGPVRSFSNSDSRALIARNSSLTWSWRRWGLPPTVFTNR